MTVGKINGILALLIVCVLFGGAIIYASGLRTPQYELTPRVWYNSQAYITFDDYRHDGIEYIGEYMGNTDKEISAYGDNEAILQTNSENLCDKPVYKISEDEMAIKLDYQVIILKLEMIETPAKT